MEESNSELLRRTLGEQQTHMLHLQYVVRKIKVNSLVNQFVYKLKRNLVLNQPEEYEKIKESLTQIKSRQRFFKTLKLNDKLVAIFMVFNIFAILFIQTLSAFQGFYVGYEDFDAKRAGIIIIELICLGIFVIKLVFSFFTSYSISGVREKYIRYVAKNYFFSWVFVFDFLILLTTLFKILFPTSSFFGILCFVVTALSFPVISKGFQVMESVFFNNFRRRQYFALFKIFMFNIFFAQFVSSIMMAISYWDKSNNWIDKAISNGNMAPNLTWWQIYFYSFYWAITTLATVGYGDLTPANYFEVAFVGLIMLFGTAVLSYNLSEIGSVISNLRSIDQRRKEETVIFKRMSKDENISEELETKILDYINKSAEVRAQFEFSERKEFLDKLPEQLRDEFQSEYSTNIFKKIPFFNLLDHTTLVSLSMKLQGAIYYSGESLTKKDGTLPSIMFLKHGKIGFAYLKSGSMLNGLVLEKREIDRDKDSPYLLNKYLLTADREINYQIVAQSYCFMLVLEYDDFYEGLRSNRKDNEFYFSLYSRVSQIDQEWDNFQCKYCSPKRHTLFMCPRLHYMPYKSLLVQKETLGPNIEQQRKPIFVRKDNKLKHKKSLIYWKEFHQYVEIEFSAGYVKKSEKSQVESSEKISAEDAKDEMVYKVTGEVLKMHCCELNMRYVETNEFQIDKMHNFQYFFTDSNPQNLNMLSLKLSKKLRLRIPVRY